MPNFAFEWTPRAYEKLDDNNVTWQEFERIVRKATVIETSRSTGKPACRGRIGNKVLFCIFEMIDDWRIKPTTAFWIHED